MTSMENKPRYKKTKLGWIPEDWKIQKMKDVSLKIQDGTHFSPQVSSEGIYKYITSKNIRNGYLKLDNIDYLSAEEHSKIYSRCDVRYGDVLLTKDGANTGNVCINNLSEEFSLLSSVAFVRADTKVIDNLFLYQFMSSSKFKTVVRDSMSGQAITRITLKKLRNYAVVVPPLPEQQKIATILSTWDKAIDKLSALIEAKEEQKKGLMQRLLTGKVRLNGFEGEWEERKLKDILKIEKGKSLSKKNTVKGKYPVIAGGKSSPYSHNKYTHKDVVTISASGAYAGYVSYHADNIWASDCSVIQSEYDKSHILFVYYLLKMNQNRIYSLQSGGAQPHVYPKDIQLMSFLVPPVPEQKYIAELLYNTDKEIENLCKNIEYLNFQKKGLMQQLLTGKTRVQIQ